MTIPMLELIAKKKKENHKQIKSMPGREGKNGTIHPKPRAVNSAGMLAGSEAWR